MIRPPRLKDGLNKLSIHRYEMSAYMNTICWLSPPFRLTLSFLLHSSTLRHLSSTLSRIPVVLLVKELVEFLFQIETMSAQCFFPNGTQQAQAYLPCDTTATENGQHSACCVSNDRCLGNGMCLGPNAQRDHLNVYWREGCTDSTFEDVACLKYCIEDQG